MWLHSDSIHLDLLNRKQYMNSFRFELRVERPIHGSLALVSEHYKHANNREWVLKMASH